MAVQQINFTQLANSGGVAGQVLVANSSAVTWGDANNTAFLGGTAAAGYQTTAGLAANVATLTANNANNLGGVAAASYVQNTDSRTLSGNLTFTGTTVTIGQGTTVQLLSTASINVDSFASLNLLGAVYSNGSLGTSGQVLATNGSNTYWTSSVLSANNANNLGGVAAASYVQNTDSRTLSGNLAFSGANNTFSGNLTISATGELIIAAGAGIYANGGVGTAGQVLTSNASSVYWSTVTVGAGVNTDSQYSWTNTQTFSNTITFSSNILVGTSANAATLSVGTNFIANTSRVTISGVPLFANGGAGTAGQILTSNGSTGSPYWATAAGGGVTLADETASATTHYPTMSTTSTGSWTAGRVSTTKLYFTPSTGQLNATVFNSLSDAKVKKDIVTFTNALEIVDNIRGVRYNWVDNGQPSIGVIAQEIEKYLPELVTKGHEGEMSVNYGGLVGVLIEAIKELNERINKLEGK